MPVKNLGKAEVSVEADVKPFGAGLQAKLKQALAGGDREAKRAGKRLGRQLADSIGDELVRRAPFIRRRINTMLRGISVTAKVKVDIDVDSAGLKGQASKIASRVKGHFSSEIFGGMFSAAKASRGLFGKMAANPALLAAAVSLIAVAGTAAAGAINSIGREMLNLVKVSAFLPATIAVIGATALTLKLAFSGVGDAIEAAFSKDPEKLKKALEGLTPAARHFVLEIQKAIPLFEKIKATAQQRFFAPLVGTVTMMTEALGSTVVRGVKEVATSLGMLFQQIGALFSSEKTVTFLQRLFETTGNIITTLSGPITRLISAFMTMAQAAFPGLEGVATSVGDMIDRFAAWIEGAVADGRFQEWLDSAKRTTGELFDLIKELAELFGVLFDDANKEGDSFLVTTTNLIKKWKDFAASQEGKLAMEGMAAAAKVAGAILIGTLGTLWLMTAAVGSLFGATERAINALDRLAAKNKAARFTIGGLGGLAGGLIAQNAEGGIIKRPTLSTLAEDGEEAVIPLTKPGRARKILRESGLDQMFGGGKTTQIFYLGEEQVYARMVQVVDGSIGRAVTDADYGVRTV
jgi:hypothetical protein